jgi:hypothetical protein
MGELVTAVDGFFLGHRIASSPIKVKHRPAICAARHRRSCALRRLRRRVASRKHVTRRGPRLVSTSGHQLFEQPGLLGEPLQPYPDVRIVLSTSWGCAYRGVHRVARRLPPALRARVIGATWHSATDTCLFRAAPRGMQVWADVLRPQPDAWLALDDDWLHWPAWCRDRLVRTDEILGIAEPTVLQHVREKLAALGDAY